ncbi:hypothetical protein [Rhodococcus sp. UNC363MFTsu5.1]|uniref:hypothetical protein n=1 Tax=Rhodococcus sp. UNC363MFTsu5.1 TaxID=1449069 RepID=UPI001E289EA4|nr:hypothetical protein [Rhodococcus sp. UNC363MFTsu5.1]
MNESPRAPLSGSWSMPDTLTGLAAPPRRPTGVYIRRTRPGRVHPQYIDCSVLPAGRDADGTYWWVPVPVVDTWIDPKTDRILYDHLPPDSGIQGMEVSP